MNQQSQKKGLMTIGCVVGAIVCLMVSIAVMGILAAIAIPAFAQYMDRSKAAEAEGMVYSIADQVEIYYRQNCEFPPELPATYDVASCCGAEPCPNFPGIADEWAQSDVFLFFSENSYFSYSTRSLDGSTYRIEAVADFSCGGPNHTYYIDLVAEGDGGANCQIRQESPVLLNEFQ